MATTEYGNQEWRCTYIITLKVVFIQASFLYRPQNSKVWETEN
jgi:hypothetical protein